MVSWAKRLDHTGARLGEGVAGGCACADSFRTRPASGARVIGRAMAAITLEGEADRAFPGD